MIDYVIQKRLVFPRLYIGNSDQKNKVVYQIDNALMSAGFKLSHELFNYLRQLDDNCIIDCGVTLINSLDKLVGNHVKHNTFFKRFPVGVPDTFDFWFDQIIKLFFTGTCEYGRYQHSYEEMLAFHENFKDKFGTDYRVIHLGSSLDDELRSLYKDLAGSSVPLSPEDRELLSLLVAQDYTDNVVIPVRENKAIVNSFLLRKNKPLQVDTLTDILRVAVLLSGGDVTLENPSKIKNLSRPIRKSLLSAIDAMAGKNFDKVEDTFSHREIWKRLGEKLHPHEHSYSIANQVFAVVRGQKPYERWAGKVQSSFINGRYTKAINFLSEKPGYLFRNIDRIARNCNDVQFKLLLDNMKNAGQKVSSRVLLSLREFLINRNDCEFRTFVNYKGKAHVEKNNLSTIHPKRINKIAGVIDELLIANRPKEDLVLDVNLKNFSSISLPLSEKNKSDGLDVLPRGSSIIIGKERKVVRFFIYWKEKSQRTDYDLSCVFLDRDFNQVSQVSWTRLNTGGYSTHSGDITSAPKGASEFIDIKIDQLPKEVYYFVPSVNVFSGETFSDTEECFFGYMERDLKEFGKPFEPKTVKTKFALRGKGKIALPLAFYKDNDDHYVKWMDLYSKGLVNYNMVEKNQLSTTTLVKGIVTRKYLTLDYLLSLYEKAGVSIQYTDQTTSDVITLNSLSRLID